MRLFLYSHGHIILQLTRPAGGKKQTSRKAVDFGERGLFFPSKTVCGQLAALGLEQGGEFITLGDSIRRRADKTSQCESGWPWAVSAGHFLSTLQRLAHSLSPGASAV